jgi:hypothetical protein
MACNPERERQLLAEGWARQFTAEEPRLGEAVAQYLELGLEVLQEPVDPLACRCSGGCAACYETPEAAARFKVIFTRKAAKAVPTPLD